MLRLVSSSVPKLIAEFAREFDGSANHALGTGFPLPSTNEVDGLGSSGLHDQSRESCSSLKAIQSISWPGVKRF